MKDVMYAALDKENAGFILSQLNYLEKNTTFIFLADKHYSVFHYCERDTNFFVKLLE